MRELLKNSSECLSLPSSPQRRTSCETKRRSTEAGYVKRETCHRIALPRHDPRLHGAQRSPRYDSSSGGDVSGCRQFAEFIREQLTKNHRCRSLQTLLWRRSSEAVESEWVIVQTKWDGFAPARRAATSSRATRNSGLNDITDLLTVRDGNDCSEESQAPDNSPEEFTRRDGAKAPAYRRPPARP